MGSRCPERPRFSQFGQNNEEKRSVLKKRKITQKNKSFLPITDKRMTRFSITLDQGVAFVIFCLKEMWGGEIFVPKIPSYRIMDLAKAISPSAKFKFVGIRPGEKIHEEMISTNESLNTVEFKNYFAIIPKSDFINWDKKNI